MATIERTPWKTTTTIPDNLSHEAKLTVDHCLAVLDFVLPFNEAFTFTQWATEIEKAYDNPTVSFFAAVLVAVDNVGEKPNV